MVNQIKYKKVVTLTFSETVTKRTKMKTSSRLNLPWNCIYWKFIALQVYLQLHRTGGEGKRPYLLSSTTSNHSLTWRQSIAVMQLRSLLYNFDINVCNKRPLLYTFYPPSWWNPPSRGEGACLTKRFQLGHQQEELLGVILLLSSRTNGSS